MTSKIPNPSFIIINSHEQETHDLQEHIDHAFPSSTIYYFQSLDAYVSSLKIIESDKIVIILESSVNFSLDSDCKIITKISSDTPTILLLKNLDFESTQTVINLGISEILIANNLTAIQLQQSVFMSLSRKRKQSVDLAEINKRHFLAMLRLHYDDLTVTVDLNLNILEASKNSIAALESKSAKLSEKNLQEYVHLDDLWILENVTPLFENRDNIIFQSVRLKVAAGQFRNFELNFFKDSSNADQYVVSLKDLTNKTPEEDLRRDNNERFSAVAESTNSTVYEMFIENRKLFTANSSGIYGMIEGVHLEEYFEQYYLRIHPEDRLRLENSFNCSTIAPMFKPSTNQYRLLQANGRYQTILERYRVISHDGVAFKRIGALTDITKITAQNALIALEKQVYEMDADQDIDFSQVIAYLECKMEELIPYSKCMVLTMNNRNEIESISQRDHNNLFVSEIAKSSTTNNNPLCDKVAHRGKISESARWTETMKITEHFNYNYFRTSPATNKEKETIANVVLLFSEQLEADEIEEELVHRITNLVGLLISKNKAITETKTSKERYEMVGKATNDTIWEWNVDVDVLDWNKGIFEIFGYTQEKIEKTSTWWFSRVHPEDSIRVSVKLYNFLEQKTEKWQDEYRFECADGTYKYVLDRGFLEKNKEGKAIRMIGSIQDVTQSKLEEERLKLLSAAITQANDAVIITETPRSIYALPKIVYVNPAFSKMTGYQDDEVVGKSPSLFIGKNAMAEQQSILSKATEFNKEFIFEAINQHKDGQEYWVRFSMIPVLDNRGEHSHWVSIQSDITNQKEQEKEKEHLIQELTRHNNDLKQFSYITSHNMRAPLSNLIGLLNLIEDIVIEDDDLKEIIEGFSKSTHLLNQTINDLIKIVIIKDNLSIDIEVVNIKDVLNNIMDQLSYTISQYSPIITIDTTEAPILFINKPYIESIFLNLITNALRYSSPDRILEIEISSKLVEDETVLTFKDNGIGIDLERNADKLFGLYQRFHDYPDSKGLGLYLVKSQVISMGGTIDVKSELGIGSSFILTFKNKK